MNASDEGEGNTGKSSKRVYNLIIIVERSN